MVQCFFLRVCKLWGHLGKNGVEVPTRLIIIASLQNDSIMWNTILATLCADLRLKLWWNTKGKCYFHTWLLSF